MDIFYERVIRELGMTSEQILEIRQLSKSQSIIPAHAAIRLKIADPTAILSLYANVFNLQIADLDSMDIPGSIINKVPTDIAVKNKVVPIDVVGQNIILAMLDPQNLKIMDLIRFKTGYHPRAVLASETSIENAITRYYKTRNISISDTDKQDASKSTIKTVEDRTVIDEQNDTNENHGPIIHLVNELLMQCLNRRASDIHIEPYETYLRIRFRIDGALYEVSHPPLSIKNALISRIKIMSKINIAEKRKPQDGSIRVMINDKPIDFRVNTCPTIHGEKVVLRILDKSNLQVDMTKLGLEKDDLNRFLTALNAPFGMILVTGPTGSGKTTTLYSALSELNKNDTNLVTAEDPVEFNIEGINQVQVQPIIDFTFAAALRAFLRQDPDVIMVGEIRDLETAEIAIKAALTGHMVLSTLHTNTAADTITRLTSLGIDSFNLTSSLNAIVAQRLVRKICQRCKIIDTSVKAEHLKQLGVSREIAASATVYKGSGCSACSNTGFKGRIAIFEVLTMSDDIRQAIMERKSVLDLKKIAIQTGMNTLRKNAIRKLIAGETDISEVIQTTASDNDVTISSTSKTA